MKWAWVLLPALVLGRTPAEVRQALSDADLLLVTVASEPTDGYRRYQRSLREFGLEDSALTLGLGQPWMGGDMTSAGGGYKIRLLREGLEKYKDKEDLIILFTDSYDVIVNGNRDEILGKFFTEFDDARVVFSAEGYCWPDKTLATKYPIVKSADDVEDKDDDQLYYTLLYLDQEFREEHGMRLDSSGKLMQNLNGALEDIKVELSAPHGIAGELLPGNVRL